ncbi:hypothetical protein PG985_007471 [Apiospora marii]|uniref:Uncharacterized protein n=1 Tax=Apiospora marii TaxID=335849 RepID=A0ABR1SPV1_9PEZI
MPPRKSAPRESLSDADAEETAFDIDSLAPPAMNDAAMEVMQHIAGMRSDFADIQKRKQQEHAEKLVEVEKRYAKRAEEDKYKQETHVRELLERLDQALQKKMACEEAMMQVVNSVQHDTEVFQVAISSIYEERIQQCEEGVAMADQVQEDGIPLIPGERRQRARIEKLME